VNKYWVVVSYFHLPPNLGCLDESIRTWIVVTSAEHDVA